MSTLKLLQIAERGEQFRQQIGSLELLANTHNGVVTNLTPLETPLMQPKLEAVVEMIEQKLMVRGPVAIATAEPPPWEDGEEIVSGR